MNKCNHEYVKIDVDDSQFIYCIKCNHVLSFGDLCPHPETVWGIGEIPLSTCPQCNTQNLDYVEDHNRDLYSLCFNCDHAHLVEKNLDKEVTLSFRTNGIDRLHVKIAASQCNMSMQDFLNVVLNHVVSSVQISNIENEHELRSWIKERLGQ